MTDDLTISDNLRHLLQVNENLSLSELARQTKIPQPTLHHLINGTTKKPRKEVLEKLANYFSVSTSQLIGSLPLSYTIPDSIKRRLNITTLPILNWEVIRSWPHVDKASLNLPELVINKQMGVDAFALIMKKAYLEPLFPEDTLLIFDTGKETQDRDFTLVHKVNEDKLLFNRIFLEKNALFIKQDLPDENIQLIKLNKEDKIMGTLIEVRLQF